MEKATNSVQRGKDTTANSKPVKAKSDAATGLRDLFVDGLKDI